MTDLLLLFVRVALMTTGAICWFVAAYGWLRD